MPKTPKPPVRPAKRSAPIAGNGGETHQTAGGSVESLTTRHGVPISDDQNTLTAGERGPQLLEDFVMREKIFHFDHERIPERVVHARGFGVKGYFEPLRVTRRHHQRRLVPASRRADRGVRPLLDGGREQGLLRPGS